MKKIILFCLALMCISVNVCAQPKEGSPAPTGVPNGNAGGLGKDLMNDKRTSSVFVVQVNSMTLDTKRKINTAATNFRKNRGASTVIKPAFYGGVSSVFTVIANEIVNLAKLRSNQKKEWMEMRQKECTFVDSLASVGGQSDFYGKPSTFGPLDPSDMNFDGITLLATRDGQNVLKMVCHIDTTRLDHLFLHSKFYLVPDTIEFYPYRSYLPNFRANNIDKPDSTNMELLNYYNTINHFSFDDSQNLNITIHLDISSSWINELVQVQQDVKLGSFSLDLSIGKDEIKDGLYSYVRSEALAKNRETISMNGECFVIPRSFMPVSATEPSWGTGEYKMKVKLCESAFYNDRSPRAKDWHRDYKMMKRLMGQKKNEYLTHIVTTFKDNANTILKATYTPVISAITSSQGTNEMGGGQPAGGGMPQQQ